MCPLNIPSNIRFQHSFFLSFCLSSFSSVQQRAITSNHGGSGDNYDDTDVSFEGRDRRTDNMTATTPLSSWSAMAIQGDVCVSFFCL